jgi:hypothetical protein
MPSGTRQEPAWWVDFLCGWSAGCIETCVLYPQSKLIFRQQLHGVAVKDAIKQMKKEGLGLLYRGLLPPLIMRTTSRSVMFGMYDTYKYLLGCPKDFRGIALTPRHSLAAFLAGATEALLCPLERIQVLLQTSKYHSQFKNTMGAFIVVSKYGPKEFYRGFSLMVLRNGGSNILWFALRDPVKEYLYTSSHDQLLKYTKSDTVRTPMGDIKQKDILKVVSDFGAGGLLGASVSTIFFPVNVVKNRMQSTLGTEYQSPSTVFRIVWRERNRSLKELYRGVHLNFTRSVMTWGITNMVYESLRSYFNQVYVIIRICEQYQI